MRIAKHGTLSMYRHHRCRCEECKKAWNEKTVQWKLAKRIKRKRQLEAIFK